MEDKNLPLFIVIFRKNAIITIIMKGKTMKIAVFDSGVGGLSVLNVAKKILPNEEYIYFADSDNVPYGVKKKNEILKLVDNSVDFLMEQDIKALVLACNTATSVGAKYLRNKYPNMIIIGMEPAVKLALDTFPNKKSLVIATPITVAGEKMNNLIHKYDKNNLIELMPLPQLVEFAENMEFNSSQVKKYLQDNFKNIDFTEYASLVLGCTHFNYFEKVLKDILPPHIKILDGNIGTVKNLQNELNKKNLLEQNKLDIEYYYSKRKINELELERIQKFNEILRGIYE